MEAWIPLSNVRIIGSTLFGGPVGGGRGGGGGEAAAQAEGDSCRPSQPVVLRWCGPGALLISVLPGELLNPGAQLCQRPVPVPAATCRTVGGWAYTEGMAPASGKAL